MLFWQQRSVSRGKAGAAEWFGPCSQAWMKMWLEIFQGGQQVPCWLHWLLGMSCPGILNVDVQLKYATPLKLTKSSILLESRVCLGQRLQSRLYWCCQRQGWCLLSQPALRSTGLSWWWSACGFSCVSSWRMAQKAAGEQPQASSAKLPKFFLNRTSWPWSSLRLAVFSCVHQRIILGIITIRKEVDMFGRSWTRHVSCWVLVVPRKLEPDGPRDLVGYQGDFEHPALNGPFPETDAVVQRGAAGMLHWIPGGMLQTGLLAAEMNAACCCFLKRELPPLVFKQTQSVCLHSGCRPFVGWPACCHRRADSGMPDFSWRRSCYVKTWFALCAASLQYEE